MNDTDPFRVRQFSTKTPLALLRHGADYAARTVSELQESVEEYSTRLLDAASVTSQHSLPLGMSNPVPRHRPFASGEDGDSTHSTYASSNTTNTTSTTAEHVWYTQRGDGASSPANAGGVGEKLQDMFKGKGKGGELPMYKDKPYSYTASSRRRSLLKQPRFFVALLGIFALVFYWGGGLSSVTSAVQGLADLGEPASTWDDRRDRVREAFKVSWSAYEKNAWGYDEYHPISQNGRQMVPDGMGWIIVDALDTMILMNLTTELGHAREWVANNLTYEKDHDVNTFETTIRMLGGLLSAHYLSTQFPDMAPLPRAGPNGDDLYLEKASDLADRLLGAYESQSGVPFASVNLKTRKGIESHDDGGASSTAEAATLQLEMKYLSKLTGESSYWEASEKVMEVLDGQAPRDGLVPIYVYANSGEFRGNNIRLGSRGDSYYEYLIKQYLQTSAQEPIYNQMWEESLAGVKKHLVAYTEHAKLTIIGERPSGLDSALSPKMDHLVCFMPGTIALAATGGATLAEARRRPSWGMRQEEDIELARQLMKTCWAMYRATHTGLSPEITHFHLGQPPHMMSEGVLDSPDALGEEAEAAWRKDIDIHPMDLHNLQRPETVESLLYMWRITGDAVYREWGWRMFQSFTQSTFAGDDKGFSSINNVNAMQPSFRDNMESFWLAETLKYFYLLFGPNDVLPLDKIVLNTEAHPFPRFELGKLFKTGWTRKARGAGMGAMKIEKDPGVPEGGAHAA